MHKLLLILLPLFSLSSTAVANPEPLDPEIVAAMKAYRQGKLEKAGRVFHRMALQGKNQDLATIALRITRGDYGLAEYTLARCLFQEAALHGGIQQKKIIIDFYLYKLNPFNDAKKALVWKKFLADKGDPESIGEFKKEQKSLKNILVEIEQQARTLDQTIVRHMNNQGNIHYCPQ